MCQANTSHADVHDVYNYRARTYCMNVKSSALQENLGSNCYQYSYFKHVLFSGWVFRIFKLLCLFLLLDTVPYLPYNSPNTLGLCLSD